jgi:hypothetical protein
LVGIKGKKKNNGKKMDTQYLAQCKQRIESSRKWRKEDGYDGTWRRMVDMYKGRHFDDYKTEDRMLVNISFSTINVISPSISVNYPKISVNAVSPDNAAQAVIAEAVVNYWWRHRDIRSQFRRSVKDMLNFRSWLD